MHYSACGVLCEVLREDTEVYLLARLQWDQIYGRRFNILAVTQILNLFEMYNQPMLTAQI